MTSQYTVIAREAFKEPSLYFYEGTHTTEELETLTVEQVKEESSTEYEEDDEAEVYIDFIFQSDSSIKCIYS
jgi:hypothetical protein